MVPALPWLQLLEELAGQKVDGRLIIAINSITKLFVGDVVERGEATAGNTCAAGMCAEGLPSQACRLGRAKWQLQQQQ